MWWGNSIANQGAEHKYIVYMQPAVYYPESTYQLP